MDEVWKKSGQRGNEGARIHLPRFDMQFELKIEEGNLRAICLQAPDFFLESPAAWIDSKPHDNALLLGHRNKENIYKACLPFQPLTDQVALSAPVNKNASKALDTQLTFNRKLKEGIKSQLLFVRPKHKKTLKGEHGRRASFPNFSLSHQGTWSFYGLI